MTTKTYCWRRLDFPGLEILQFRRDASGIEACGTIIDAGEGQFSLQALWSLGADWRSRSLELTQESREGTKTLRIERGQRSWIVDDKLRPDLAECLEVDVSATPFCNGLALRRFGHEPGELTALYVDASDLSVQPSRQRYERLGERRWRYVDLGAAKGFEAVLDFDRDGIVERYEGLFERV
jgi:uncharacterized protein